jgi:hypothetical protein
MILLDHNMAGDRDWLLGALMVSGWLELFPLQFNTFAEVGLPADSSDREVWRFVQERRMLLLTDNRNMEGEDSLEQTLREEVTSDSLPVLTIGRRERLADQEYRAQCADRLVEVSFDLERYHGYSRLFIP